MLLLSSGMYARVGCNAQLITPYHGPYIYVLPRTSSNAEHDAYMLCALSKSICVGSAYTHSLAVCAAAKIFNQSAIQSLMQCLTG